MRQVCASQNIIVVLNKPLHDQAAGILEDNAQGWQIIWKINSRPRREASIKATVKF